MNKQPFDLQRALAGDPVITRGGLEVKDLAYFPSIKDPGFQSVRAVVSGVLNSFCATGKYFFDGQFSELDLFMAPKKEKVFVRAWRHSDGRGLHWVTTVSPDGLILPSWGRWVSEPHEIEVEE